VHRTLHLQVPPRPPSLDKQQQQQQRRQSLESTGNGSQPLSPSAATGSDQQQQQQQADLFPAAKAGLVSSRQVAEGSDGFAWAKTRKGPRASHAGQQQQQQGMPAYVPNLAGTQVGGAELGRLQQGCQSCRPCRQYVVIFASSGPAVL
jgi:hypothetical protein